MQDVPIFETVQDIQKAYAEQLQGLTKGQWLAAVSKGEGEPPTQLELIETDHIDQGMWVNKNMVDELKRYFMERDGVRVGDILKPVSEANTLRNLQEKREEKQKREKREAHTQDEATVAEEQQQAQPEVQDPQQREAPQKPKKKDRWRRVKEG